jgi:hypothetical protein
MSGAEISDGKGATIRITFADARKGVRELGVKADAGNGLRQVQHTERIGVGEQLVRELADLAVEEDRAVAAVVDLRLVVLEAADVVTLVGVESPQCWARGVRVPSGSSRRRSSRPHRGRASR